MNRRLPVLLIFGIYCLSSSPLFAETTAEEIRTKLKTIIIPNVEFSDTPLQDALAKLKSESVALDESDSKPKGISLSMKQGFAPKEKITLRLSNVPLGEALRYTTNQAMAKYRVEASGVVIVPISEPESTQMEVRQWKIDYQKFVNSSGHSHGGASTAADPFAPYPLEKRPETISAKDVLKNAGISFPADSSAVIDRVTHVLTVFNTPQQLELVDAYILSIRVGSEKQMVMQIELYEIPMARAIDLLERTKAEGDDSEVAEKLRKENGSEGIRLLSTANIIARSGNRAKSFAGTSYRYISGYEFKDQKDIPRFATAEDGTSFEVDPVLGADNVTIDLNFAFKHSMGKMEIKQQSVKSPNTGKTLNYESVIENRASFNTQITTLDRQTRFIGAANGEKPGTTLAAFVTANIRIVSR